ncbi:MAG TPA: hypothetical protein VNJ01_18260 [Bacteriovoracaceae bacterium]|nr:hypothetical protein [Bacteriovoracaceae bacterium]
MSTDWIKKWKERDTGFHQKKFNPLLMEYGDRFPSGKILVPLCGKSLDLIYLAEKGHTVIGVELSPIACREFFEDNAIEYTETVTAGFVVYASAKIHLWCGDFFNLPVTAWEGVSGIYDRAALVALPEDLRKKYAEEIGSRGPMQVEIFLISIEYPEGSIKGPPYSVSEVELSGLYRDFSLQHLHAQSGENLPIDNPRLQNIGLVETAYWLKRSQ